MGGVTGVWICLLEQGLKCAPLGYFQVIEIGDVRWPGKRACVVIVVERARSVQRWVVRSVVCGVVPYLKSERNSTNGLFTKGRQLAAVCWPH